MTGAPALCALLLAAGAGRRFDASGRRWKLAQALGDGRPVLRASCEALLGQVDEVVVVYGSREAQVAQALHGLPVRIVQCGQAAAGMGATLKCGVRATHPSVGWIVALGDMPFIAQATVAAVCAALRDGARIVRPFHQGLPGHPAGFRVDLREGLLALDDDSGAAALLRHEEILRLAVEDRGCIRDVDTPQDLLEPG